MKKLLALAVIITALFSCKEECHRKHQNLIADGRMVIIPTDTIDGRPTYSVIFNDEDVMDGLYPEEIANGLATNIWDYNEDLKLSTTKN